MSDQTKDPKNVSTEIETPEGLTADLSALQESAARRVASAVCLPKAHEADPSDVDQNGKTQGKIAKGQDRRTGARPAPELDYSGVALAVKASVEAHDKVSTAMREAGIDLDDPRAPFIRRVVELRQAEAQFPAEQLPADIAQAIAGAKALEPVISDRLAAYHKRRGE